MTLMTSKTPLKCTTSRLRRPILMGLSIALVIYGAAFLMIRKRLVIRLFDNDTGNSVSLRCFYFNDDTTANRTMYDMFAPIHAVILRGATVGDDTTTEEAIRLAKAERDAYVRDIDAAFGREANKGNDEPEHPDKVP